MPSLLLSLVLLLPTVASASFGWLGGSSSTAGVRSTFGLTASAPPATGLTVDIPGSAAEESQLEATAWVERADGTRERRTGELNWHPNTGVEIEGPGSLRIRPVVADQPLNLVAQWSTLTASRSLDAVDSNRDNFPAFAGDGIDDRWQQEHLAQAPELAAPGLDPFATGTVNRLAWALDRAPHQSGPVLSVTAEAGVAVVRFSRLPPGAEPSVLYRLEVTEDFLSWQPASAIPGATSEILSAGGLHYEEVRIPAPATPTAPQLFRLTVLPVANP